MYRTPLLAFLLALFTQGVAHAWPGDTTKEELAVLPQWCAYTNGSWGTNERPDIYNGYIQRYGHGWTHMHHYCYGLVNYNRLRSMKVPRETLHAVFRMTKADIIYTIERTEKNFPFRPEMLVTLTRVQMREGVLLDAAGTAATLVKDWPQHADGYTLFAEVLLRAGKKNEAMEVLRKGEEMSSDKERFQRLKSILPLN